MKTHILGMHFEYFFLLLLLSPFIYFMFVKPVVLKRVLPWFVKKLKELDARVESH